MLFKDKKTTTTNQKFKISAKKSTYIFEPDFMEGSILVTVDKPSVDAWCEASLAFVSMLGIMNIPKTLLYNDLLAKINIPEDSNMINITESKKKDGVMVKGDRHKINLESTRMIELPIWLLLKVTKSIINEFEEERLPFFNSLSEAYQNLPNTLFDSDDDYEDEDDFSNWI